MTHLNDAEFVALLEGQLPDARGRHAQDCTQCRTQADLLRRTLADVMTDAAPPDPSPLFWDHFAARVADAMRDEQPAASPLGWLRRRAGTWALAASVALLAIGFFAWRATLHAPAPGSSPSLIAVAPPSGEGDAALNGSAAPAGIPANADTAKSDDLELDEAWAVVRTAVEGFAWDDAHEAGISARPGSAERVALELSGDERVELARLIEGALKRTGA